MNLIQETNKKACLSKKRDTPESLLITKFDLVNKGDVHLHPL